MNGLNNYKINNLNFHSLELQARLTAEKYSFDVYSGTVIDKSTWISISHNFVTPHDILTRYINLLLYNKQYKNWLKNLFWTKKFNQNNFLFSKITLQYRLSYSLLVW